MPQETFPYRNSTSHQNDATSEQWIAALEKTGVDNVRARLASVNSDPKAAVVIGGAQMMPVGFAQEWLKWNDRQKAAATAAEFNAPQKSGAIELAVLAISMVYSTLFGGGWTDHAESSLKLFMYRLGCGALICIFLLGLLAVPLLVMAWFHWR